MLRHALSMLSLLALTGAGALVSSTASADVEATLTITDSSVVFTSSRYSSAAFDYTCTTDAADPAVLAGLALFQRDFNNADGQAYGPDPGGDEPFNLTCDGHSHADTVTFKTYGGGEFVNGEGQVGVFLGAASEPLFRDVTISGLPDPLASVLITTNASPEPARQGRAITIRGTIERDGDAYSNKSVALEFKPDGGSYTRIKDVTASSGGNLETTLRASRSGSFRYTSAKTGKTRAGVSNGDHVKVNR